VCDLSFSTVTRRRESDWGSCDARRQKLHKSLVRTAECLAGVALSPAQDGSPECQSGPCWGKEDRDRDRTMKSVINLFTYLS